MAHNAKNEDRVKFWNGPYPDSVEDCINNIVEEQAKVQPEAPAVCSFDGDLTYNVLNLFATRLARYLKGRGVGPETKVGLCFKKSKWAVIAMLGILKAGGVCVPLPISDASRSKDIVSTLDIGIILTKGGVGTLQAMSENVVDISLLGLQEASVEDESFSVAVKPSNAAFIIFTSGSTGVPKGVVLEHRNICTSCESHGKALFIDCSSRVLQYAV